MLRELHITDLGVIDDAHLDLSPGLTVVTGETGAGKTMVVTGLGLVLGGRADPGLVRAGSEQAVVEAALELPAGHPALDRAAEAGAECADGELLLARTVPAEGRSRAHVGGRRAPLGLLGELAEDLVAVHGQADQWWLARPSQHRALLDAAGGPDLRSARDEVARLHDGWRAATAELGGLVADERERVRSSTGSPTSSSRSTRSTPPRARTRSCGSSRTAWPTPSSCSARPGRPSASSRPRTRSRSRTR